ncbi:DUF6503 family protein [Portibacter lacus]|uniref:Uncharacterized protein n=1 Tax=Portibacter lacus TaxID=1099794 RepID=A0AA37WDK5_9BACT|nr:DUF6503 family protein [Portibacter lacus]GLR16993.1 hypothetical protein GCM10007940_16080 [Portibacter lacus]
MNKENFLITRQKNLILIVLAFLGVQQLAYSQENSEISSKQIFEETIKYYDKDGLWDTFSGKLLMTSLRNGSFTPQTILINNKTNLYECIRNREDGIYIKGVENGKSFFSIDGKSYEADEIPEKFQKYPYSLSTHYAFTYQEHHMFHFSIPLALKKAGAQPLERVSKKYLFGKLCSSITFTEYPNYFEEGYYGVQITLYVIPEESYRIHAVHFDNGWGESSEGIIVLFDGEIDVEGIIVPASKLTFFEGSHQFFMVDAFENSGE